jgi:hypothetical protein
MRRRGASGRDDDSTAPGAPVASALPGRTISPLNLAAARGSGAVWCNWGWSGVLAECLPSASHLRVPRKLPTTRPPYVPEDEAVTASSVVELVRQGEEVLALIDPTARGRDLIEFHAWLSARLTIGELQRLLLPRCDDRCATLEHHPDEFVVLADISVDEAPARPQSWWESWNDALEHEHQAKQMWFAGSPALLATDPTRRLVAGGADAGGGHRPVLGPLRPPRTGNALPNRIRTASR